MTGPAAATAAIDAEVALLGAVLIDDVALAEVLEVLRREHFYRENHRLIFDAITELTGLNRPVDVLSVRAHLEERGHLTQVGGVSALSQFTDYVPDVGNAKYYAKLVRSAAGRRSLVALGRELAHSSLPTQALLEKASADLLVISGEANSASVDAIGDAAALVVGEIMNPTSGPSEKVACETGISQIDQKVDIRPGNVVVVAGGTSSGKTAFATQIALHQASFGRRVLMFSLEMASEELATRLLAADTGIPIDRINHRGALSQDQQHSLLAASKKLAEVPLAVDHSVDLTVLDVRARARQQQIRSGLDLIVIDYLQLLTPMSKRGTREREVSEMSRGIKLTARALNVPILLLSQLSRRHQEERRPPNLRDLRESGSIENDADIVLMIHRPNTMEPHAELLIRKQRQGPLGKARLRFDGPTTRFRPKDIPNG